MDLSVLDMVAFIRSPLRNVGRQFDPSAWLLGSGFSGAFVIQIGNLLRDDVFFPEDPVISKHEHYKPADLIEEFLWQEEGCFQKNIIQPYLGED